MRVRLQPEKIPIRVKARRYSAEQRVFLDGYTKKLLDMDFGIEMPTAAWQAAPLIVPKPGSRSKFRLAIDLRPVNAATVKESWPMPHLDSEIMDFADSTCFASLDFVSAYWQLPVHPDSYSACGIVTPKTVIASKRVLPGLANATSYFQSTVEPLFRELRDSLKAWLDDFTIHSKTERKLLSVLDKFFEICGKAGLFLSALKSKLFAKKLKWCGRVISREGYSLDPRRLDGLREMCLPETADELAELIYCCRWMSMTIPDFTRRIALLNQVLEEAYAQSGKRTKRSIKKIKLSSLSWGSAHTAAFHDLRGALQNAVTLSYPRQDMEICIFTDASELYWSGILTQTNSTQLDLPFERQVHEPLAFLGGEFKGAELGWTTFEKEGYAIFQAFDKMDYMLMGIKQTHVFTDHRNLLFVFAPLALEPALGRHIVSKVQRWALFLSRFSYVIEHIDGSENVFADILTRWTKGYRKTNPVFRTTVCSLLDACGQITPSADEIVWPDAEVIRSAQVSSTQRPSGLTFDSVDQLWKKDQRIWIPAHDVDLQLKILVASHCGVIGHRGTDATKSILRESFRWENLDADVDELIKGCIHCLLTRSGDIIPRPLAHALHGELPNEVVHLDYLYMGKSTEGKVYLLILRDDHSSYVWLFATEAANAEEAAGALSTWLGSFGSMDWIVTDQASHFKNQLTKEFTRETHIQHHFTTAYSPWANGSVERVCKEVLRACRALCSEWKLAPKDWPAVTECIQSVINQAPLKRLGLRDPQVPGVYRTPLEVFTGHKPSRPLLRALPVQQYQRLPSLDEIRARQLINTDSLQLALGGMHKDVKERATASRRKKIDVHNRKTNVQPVNFQVGDFVLMRRAQGPAHKLQFKWMGPRRVVATKSALVFEVERLQDKHRETVHARRLLLYRADMDGKQVDPKLLRVAEHTEASYQDVRAIRNIRERSGRIEICVEWEGLPDKLDYTWESLETVHEDVPEMLREFLDSSKSGKLKSKASAQCKRV